MGKITRQEFSAGVTAELDRIGDTTNLNTTDKSNLVAAINEVESASVEDPGNVLGGTTSDEHGVSIHPTANADGVATIAIGRNVATGNIGTGTGDGHIAIGDGAETLADNSLDRPGNIAIGLNAKVEEARYGIALGQESLSGFQGVAIGYKAEGGRDAVSIGARANEWSIEYGDPTESVSIGYYAWSGQYGTAVGSNANAQGVENIAIGNAAKTGNTGTGEQTGSIAIGRLASTQVENSLNYDYMVAIGINAQATESNQGVLGVADGAAGTYNWKIPGNLDVGNNFTLKSPNGTLYNVSVADDGVLTTTEVV